MMTRRGVHLITALASVLFVLGGIGIGVGEVRASPSSHNIELTDANFEQVILSAGVPALVEFYLPTCGHCQRFAATYDDIAKDLTTMGFAAGKVDVQAQRSLGQKYGIETVPTLISFSPGKPPSQQYAGDRSHLKVVKWVLEQTKPEVLTLSDPSTLRSHLPVNFNSPIPRLVLLSTAPLVPSDSDTASDIAQRETLAAVSKFLADRFKDTMRVITVYGIEDSRETNLFNVQEFPALVVVDWTAKSTPFRSEFSTEPAALSEGGMPFYYYRGPLHSHIGRTDAEREADSSMQTLFDFSKDLVGHVRRLDERSGLPHWFATARNAASMFTLAVVAGVVVVALLIYRRWRESTRSMGASALLASASRLRGKTSEESGYSASARKRLGGTGV